MPRTYVHDNLTLTQAKEQRFIFEEDGASVVLSSNPNGTYKLVATYPDDAVSPAASLEYTLSWEKGHPDRREWSKALFTAVSERLKEFDLADDIATIRPGYADLGENARTAIWSEFICGVALYESSWNPVSRMKETSFSKKDAVTGDYVWSEGLLQLSYQDVNSYSELDLGFDWQRDRHLAADDPKKTILDPIINLTAGTKIMANFVKSRHRVIVKDNVYWAVLREGGKYAKIQEISKMVADFEV